MESLIDRRTLRRMAGARAFERGEDYCAGGQVRALVEHENVITAKVLGTREYRVKLWVENGDLEFSCTCPVGTDGAFCKHCVAVGLAWLGQGREGGATSKRPAKPSVTMDDVRTHLIAQGKEALVDLLVERAMEDDRTPAPRPRSSGRRVAHAPRTEACTCTWCSSRRSWFRSSILAAEPRRGRVSPDGSGPRLRPVHHLVHGPATRLPADVLL